MSLKDKLKNANLPSQKYRDPVWKGPEEDGVTFSLLSRFLVCRERFRILVVEGLRPDEGFNHRIEYGHMWHVCEEALAATGAFDDANVPPHPVEWEGPLKAYAKGLCKKYPLSQPDIDKWFNVCKVQFPLYVDYWRANQDVTERTPLMQEHVFDVPYKLPSGRIVRLRGKFDSVDLIGKGDKAGVYLQENKTKGDINEGQLKRQLTFDLQTMMYLTALTEEQDRLDDSTIRTKLSYRDGQYRCFYPIKGARYNVVRRPLSGGKGSIVRHKATKNQQEETWEHYYGRLRDIISESPGEFFMRWKAEVSQGDIKRFRRECLDPLLENLCQWWEVVSFDGGKNPWGEPMAGIHWRHPFGVYNVMDEGGSSDLDEYLESGSEVGLKRVDGLFEELT